LEAHPFSIASLPLPKNNEDTQAKDEVDELVFIVRARGGMTRRLQELALEGKPKVPVYLDGPYGNPPDLSPYVTSVLIAGQPGVHPSLTYVC
jgi:ferric-chelate reductase